MNLVFAKICVVLIEGMPDVFRKLKRFVGEYRFEAQKIYEREGVLTVSFYTDKVKIKEGESRLVNLECRRNSRGSWYFTNISK